ncbi:MAG: chromate transporter, partial [Treponema sp.]|nr:chromate transporter [Treponema sp.]
MSLLLIYLEFCKVGLFAVGGGLATLPFLFHMAAGHFSFVRSSGWLSAEQVGNFLAIAQCSPGPVGVNIAVQAGFLYGGVAAGVAAAVGLISPAIIVITAVSKALQALGENKTAASVFSGLRPAAAGLLAAAGWGVWR